MAASAKVRFDGDTAGLSSSMARLNNVTANFRQGLGRAVPILGAMTTSFGLIAGGIAVATNAARQYNAEIEKGNRGLEKSVTSAVKLAGATGDFGGVSTFRAFAESAAGEGALGTEALLQGAAQFRDAAPGASRGQTAQAIRRVQRVGTSGMDVTQVTRIAGTLMATGAVDDVSLAFDYAAMLYTAMGSDAAQAAETISHLIASGMTIDEAAGIAIAFAQSGISRRDRQTALRTLATGQVRGLAGAQRALRGADPRFRSGLIGDTISGLSATDPGDVRGFINRSLGELAGDDQVRQDILIRAAQNRRDVRQQVTARRDMELARTLQQEENVGRIDPIFFGSLVDRAQRNTVGFDTQSNRNAEQILLQGADAYRRAVSTNERFNPAPEND